MEKFKVAICVIAYNEERNVARLLQKTIGEKFNNSHIFVYTDGSTDKTANIVDAIEAEHGDLITHIRGLKRRGKHRAYNSLLKRIKGYKYTIFLDADIDFECGTLVSLVEYLNNSDYLVVSPRLIPIGNKISDLYVKVKQHIYKYGKYVYFTGRLFAARTNCLPIIPEESYSDDFYLNLQFSTDEIGLCMTSKVKYYMPTSPGGMFWYSFRIGSYLADIKNNYRKLWREQRDRTPLIDYGVYGLTQYKFNELWNQLGGLEKCLFAYSRIVTMAGFFGGYLFGNRYSMWKPIEETKRDY